MTPFFEWTVLRGEAHSSGGGDPSRSRRPPGLREGRRGRARGCRRVRFRGRVKLAFTATPGLGGERLERCFG